jgi:hypothetical protein
MKISEMHQLLHAVAIKKHADAAILVSSTGINEKAVSALLEHATASGRVATAQGKVMLTPAGQMILQGQYGHHYAALRKEPNCKNAYENFEILNIQLKQIITDWQTVSVAGQNLVNDHGDTDYDQKVIGRMADTHERLEQPLAILSAQVRRLDIYWKRLCSALDKVEDGALEWVSDVRIDSYHTVWFEMHEDLLRIFDRERVE